MPSSVYAISENDVNALVLLTQPSDAGNELGG
jgi:hypothetical protein